METEETPRMFENRTAQRSSIGQSRADVEANGGEWAWKFIQNRVSYLSYIDRDSQSSQLLV